MMIFNYRLNQLSSPKLPLDGIMQLEDNCVMNGLQCKITTAPHKSFLPCHTQKYKPLTLFKPFSCFHYQYGTIKTNYPQTIPLKNHKKFSWQKTMRESTQPSATNILSQTQIMHSSSLFKYNIFFKNHYNTNKNGSTYMKSTKIFPGKKWMTLIHLQRYILFSILMHFFTTLPIITPLTH